MKTKDLRRKSDRLLGFRVFELDTSNIRAWEPDRDDLDGALLENIEHIKPGRSEEDILYEVLLKLGLDLCFPIETLNIVGKTVQFYRCRHADRLLGREDHPGRSRTAAGSRNCRVA